MHLITVLFPFLLLNNISNAISTQPDQSYGVPPSTREFSKPISSSRFRPIVTNKYHARSGTEGQVEYSSSSTSSKPSESSSISFNSQTLNSGGKTYRHVTVHIAPKEMVEIIPARSIEPQGKPDTHYQIIFIKAPNPPVAQETEVELPPLLESKTVVYVLVKDRDVVNEVKVKAPPPTKPSKPEVYFIRYKNDNDVPSNYQSEPDDVKSTRTNVATAKYSPSNSPSVQYGVDN